jgi:hypothetical protein
MCILSQLPLPPSAPILRPPCRQRLQAQLGGFQLSATSAARAGTAGLLDRAALRFEPDTRDMFVAPLGATLPQHQPQGAGSGRASPGYGRRLLQDGIDSRKPVNRTDTNPWCGQPCLAGLAGMAEMAHKTPLTSPSCLFAEKGCAIVSMLISSQVVFCYFLSA